MFNRVEIIGRLGNDPEIRIMQSGKKVANVSVATSERWKDKQTGEKREETEWHRVVFFTPLAEIVEQYLKKGALVFIEGKLKTNKWQDKEGSDRYSTNIQGSKLQMLGNGGGDNQQQKPEYQAQQPQSQYPPQQQPPSPPVQPLPQEFNEDVPF